RLSRARRQELKHCAPEVLRSEGPPAVGRELIGLAFAEEDLGRAIELANVDPVGLDVLLVEEDQLSVAGEVDRKRPVEPGQVSLRASRGRTDDLAPRRGPGEEDAPAAGDVVERVQLSQESPWNPSPAREGDRLKRRARPDLVAFGRPGESPAGKAAGAGEPRLSVVVHDPDRCRAVPD